MPPQQELVDSDPQVPKLPLTFLPATGAGGGNKTPLPPVALVPDDPDKQRPDRRFVWQYMLTFGHRNHAGELLKPSRVENARDDMLTVVGEMCGGAFALDHSGAYRRDDGSTMLEPGTSVIGYASSLHDRLPTLEAAARRVGNYLDQQCVLILITQLPGLLLYVRADGSGADELE